MPEQTAFDVATIDFSQCVADRELIRRVNPHRHEFELLTAVVLIDPGKKIAIGYKDVEPTEFWCRGHFPGKPVMPGVLMLEAAAQLCNYYTVTEKVVDEDALMGLGGFEDVRYYRPVTPGNRLVIVGEGLRMNRRMTKCKATGYVGNERAFEAVVIGVPIGKISDLKQ